MIRTLRPELFPKRALLPHTFFDARKRARYRKYGTIKWQPSARILLLEVNSPQFNKFRCLGSTRALALVLLFGKQGRFDMAQGKP